MTLLLALLFTKHLLADFVLQTNAIAAQKHDLARPGLYFHALTHTWLTLAALIVWAMVYGDPPSRSWAVAVPILDGALHFAIDYIKARLTKHYALTPARPAYWWALGTDQYLHALTYLGIAYLVTT